MKNNENHWQLLKIIENLWKLMKFIEKHWNSKKIFENQWKSLKINELLWERKVFGTKRIWNEKYAKKPPGKQKTVFPKLFVPETFRSKNYSFQKLFVPENVRVQKQCISLRNIENHWKSMKIDGIQWKSMKIQENCWKSLKINEKQWKRWKQKGSIADPKSKSREK